MIKQKLIKKRKDRGFSQEEMAHQLNITQAQYSRRESGKTRISKKEWDALAKILETPLEEIYEPHDGMYVINYENANGDYSGSHNHFTGDTDFVSNVVKKYIEKLEEENKNLKKENQSLIEDIKRLK